MKKAKIVSPIIAPENATSPPAGDKPEVCGFCGVEARSFLTEYVAENGSGIKGQVCVVNADYFHPV